MSQPSKHEPDWAKAEDLLIQAFAATGEELSRPRARAILDEYIQRIEQNLLRGTGTGGTPVGLVVGPGRSCDEGRMKRCIWAHKPFFIEGFKWKCPGCGQTWTAAKLEGRRTWVMSQ